MPAQDLIDNLITHLEAQRNAGVERVEISPPNREFLSKLQSRPVSSPVLRPAEPALPKQSRPRQERPAPTERRSGVASAAAGYKAKATPDSSLSPEELDLHDAEWGQLKELVPQCKRCQLCSLGRRQTVFGAGDENADLMFIGEGPGEDEDREGIPFVGEAGKLLTKVIQAMGFTRDKVYIANIVKCRPPRNRNPEPPEANACLPYLIRQIQLVQPKVIVILGAVPLQFLLNTKGITRNRGRWMQYRGIDVMPTFHPAYLRRKPEAKREVWEDMQEVMAKFGKTPPAAGTANS